MRPSSRRYDAHGRLPAKRKRPEVGGQHELFDGAGGGTLSLSAGRRESTDYIPSAWEKTDGRLLW
jgi:hypothetical protein